MDEHLRIGQLSVPPMALGTMYFGTRVSAGDATRCLDVAFDSGARLWDTANNYAFWAGGTGDESEHTIGTWLARRGAGVRDDVVLATKVGARPAYADGGLDRVQGLSAGAIRTQVEGSLRRLGVDNLDLLYAHIDDRSVPISETLGALGALVEEGIVREIAASNLTHARLQQALDTETPHHYRALQQRFSYLVPAQDADLTPHVLLDDALVALCQSHAMPTLGYSPLLSGGYTRPDRSLPDGYGAAPATTTALSALRRVAHDHSLDAGQTVLAWMVNRPQPVIPVVGVSRPEHVHSAWSAVTSTLAPQAVTELETARRG